MAKLFANSEDPKQMPHSAAYDLGLHWLAESPFYGSPDYNGLRPLENKTNPLVTSRKHTYIILTLLNPTFI